ncbi:MAG: hypothetical protein NCW75_13235 [Phycisphaera sp.]|nr:MAG: hypothetical protein NCW75_13235 [Phycisphaera sp.]
MITHHTTRLRTILAALTIGATLPAAALAQYEITIDVENPVLLPGESTVVTMFAGFDPTMYAMAWVITDFRTSVGSDGWSDAMELDPMRGAATSPGTPSATGFDTIGAGQFNFPTAGIYADPTNPIAFWRATYTAPADATAPFDIDLSTMTSTYDVYLAMDGAASERRLSELVEGSATIRVIPAPASASLLALGLLAAARRRR